MPAADDLFRPTVVPDAPDTPDEGGPSDEAQPTAEGKPAAKRAPSGRVRHDEKMTVYVTAAELLELEHARLSLRAEHGLAVDRGRLVREALHLVLADLEQNGDASALVRRLNEA